jgi:hypothetical protein
MYSLTYATNLVRPSTMTRRSESRTLDIVLGSTVRTLAYRQ